MFKFQLKVFPAIFMLLLSFYSCDKNDTDLSRQVAFNQGLPTSLETVEKDLPFDNFSYANLETGTDTLKVFFGTFRQGSNNGHWIALESQGIPAHFSTVTLEENDSLNYLTKDIDLEFNEGRNRISVRVEEMDQ